MGKKIHIQFYQCKFMFKREIKNSFPQKLNKYEDFFTHDE